jgi:5,10-methylenetetrahydromethanopterin reductase
MIKMGIEIMPIMPIKELIETVVAAEDQGYEYCVIADEGLMQDVFIALGAIAQRTSRIKLGPVTNGYMRHPAITASAMASLNELSGGRALLTLVPGGSMVLEPMCIQRASPVKVAQETIQIIRHLWSGESVTWQGTNYSLASAQISMGRQDIPIWMAARGPKMLELAGQMADGVILMSKSDLGNAIPITQKGSAGRTTQPTRIYLDRLAYTPEMLEEAIRLYAYTIIDSPPRLLKNLGLSEEMIEKIKDTITKEGHEAAAKLVDSDMIRQYQIAGTPEECGRMLQQLIHQYDLEIFLLDLVSENFSANIRLMSDTRSICNAMQ